MFASDFLLMDDLLKSCGSFAIQNMTSKNCLSFLSIAWQIARLAISEECFRFTLVHFEDILETTDGRLIELPFEVLRKLLDSNSLNVTSERSVWKVIVSWTEANNSARLIHVPLLLTCLRLDEEEDKDLSEEILSHTIVNNNPHIYALMLCNQFNFHTMKQAILSQCASLGPAYQNLPCSYGTRAPNRLYVVVRHTLTPTKCGSEIFLSYDNELDFWRKIGEAEFLIHTMVQIGQRLYMFNMQQGATATFDILEEYYQQNLLTFKCNGWIVTLGEQLYFINAIRSYVLNTPNVIARYESEIWVVKTTLQDMIIWGTVTLKGQICIVGESKFEPVPIMMCRAYNPEERTWIQLPPPNTFRTNFSVVVFHEQLYLIAGKNNDGESMKNVEVYNPVQNTWMPFPDLPILYYLTRAVILDDKIIVHENYDKDRRYLEVASPVFWDESAQIWRIIDESSPWYHIERYSFLVLDHCGLVKDITAKNRRRSNEWERILHVKLQ